MRRDIGGEVVMEEYVEKTTTQTGVSLGDVRRASTLDTTDIANNVSRCPTKNPTAAKVRIAMI
jgi:hypothetical protein